MYRFLSLALIFSSCTVQKLTNEISEISHSCGLPANTTELEGQMVLKILDEKGNPVPTEEIVSTKDSLSRAWLLGRRVRRKLDIVITREDTLESAVVAPI